VNPWLKLALIDELRHFALSALFSGSVAALLAWSSTRITSWLCGGQDCRSHGKAWRERPDDRYTYPLLWSAVLCVSFLVHCALDGLLWK